MAIPRSEKKGLIFNIQALSIHDGPGIRTAVFFAGCPLRCDWCSNPEGQGMLEQVMTRNALCARCGTCVTVCPVDAITVDRDERRIDRARCSQCQECVKACPNGAVVTCGKYVSAGEVVEEVAKDCLFFKNSGGGITATGGEPLMQHEFVSMVLKGCKEKGIHTAIETTGYAPWRELESVLDCVDLALYDLKHMDPEIHKRRTGVSNELILSNLQRTAHKVRTWIRVPIIPGFNDSDLDIQQVAGFSRTLPVEKVSLLPYHTWAQAKYEALGMRYTMADVEPPSDERMSELCDIVTAAGLKCTIRY